MEKMPPKAAPKAAAAPDFATAAELRRIAQQIEAGIRNGYPNLPVLRKWEAAQAAAAANRTYVDRARRNSPCCGPRRNVPTWPKIKPGQINTIKALIDEIAYERDILIQERTLLRGVARRRRRYEEMMA